MFPAATQTLNHGQLRAWHRGIEAGCVNQSSASQRSQTKHGAHIGRFAVSTSIRPLGHRTFHGAQNIG